MDTRTQNALSSLSGIIKASSLEKYLGLSLLKARVKRETFQPIIDQINCRLPSWKSKLLNKAGNLCLAKSVLQSLPMYAMQALWVSESICDEIDRAICSFIWFQNGNMRSWNLVLWNAISYPKMKGGLGLRRARQNNESLLGKLVTNIISNEEKI